MNNPNWVWRPLGEVFEIGAGKTMSAAARAGASKVPFLRTSNVLWDAIDLDVVDEMAVSEDELVTKSLRAGDLLVCEGGDIGRAAVWDGRTAVMSFQNHLHRLRPFKADVAPRFYVYFLQSAFTQLGIYEGAGNKTTIPNLSRNRLAALDIPHPSQAEQEKVASTLGLVRKSIELNNAASSAAQELKRATMTHLFTRGLRGEAQRETEFGSVPGHWLTSLLGECGEVQTGAAKGRRFGGEAVTRVPYLRVANVQDGRLDLGEMKEIEIREKELERFLLRKGDVVLTEGGDFDKLGRGFVWRDELPVCIHQNHVFAVRVDPSRLIPDFLAYLAQSTYGKAYFLKVAHKTTNLACINSTKLKAFPLIVPPTLEEQREIVTILDTLDRKIALHQKKRAVLEELFKSLLHKLMTGEIRVDQLDLSALEGAAA